MSQPRDETQPGLAPRLAPAELVGKYRILRYVGAGGMGKIALATHVESGATVALKLLHDALLVDPTIVERFEREGMFAASVQNEHVARVYESGKLEDGTPFIAMEYLQGQDLAALVEQHGALPIAKAVAYSIEACRGVAVVHAMGIIHRDLKPQNLFLATDASGSRVKLLDFGISKRVHGGKDTSLTNTGAVVGSPNYMSPEQFLDSREVDAGADIWSLGAIMYKLLTACAPFDGDTLGQLCVAVLQSPHIGVQTHRPEVPPALAAIVDRCLRKDRRERFASVTDLLAALENVDMTAGPPAEPTLLSSGAGLSGARAMAASAPPPAHAAIAGTVVATPRAALSPLARAARVATALVLFAIASSAGFLLRPRGDAVEPLGSALAPPPAALPADSAAMMALAATATAAPSSSTEAPVANAASGLASPTLQASAPKRVVRAPAIAPPLRRPADTKTSTDDVAPGQRK